MRPREQRSPSLNAGRGSPHSRGGRRCRQNPRSHCNSGSKLKCNSGLKPDSMPALRIELKCGATNVSINWPAGRAAGTAEVIHIDAARLAAQPLDMRTGSHAAHLGLRRRRAAVAGDEGVPVMHWSPDRSRAHRRACGPKNQTCRSRTSRSTPQFTRTPAELFRPAPDASSNWGLHRGWPEFLQNAAALQSMTPVLSRLTCSNTRRRTSLGSTVTRGEACLNC